MEISEELRELILVGASGLELRRKAVDEGHDHAAPERPAQSEGRRDDDRRSRQGNGEAEANGHTARTAEDDGRAGRLRPAHHAPPSPPQVRVHGHLQRLALPDLQPAETKQLVYSVLTDAQKKRFEETHGARLLVRHQGARALPLQRVQPARRGRRGLPADPREDPHLRRARPAAGARQPRRAAARPGARHRPDRQRQVDDAGGDDRQDQLRAPRPHPHDRGSDRVHPPAQELPGQPARGAQRHQQLLATRCAPRCARIRTSSSSAKCATWKRSKRR